MLKGLSNFVFIATAFNFFLPIVTLYKRVEKKINLIFFFLGMSMAFWTLCHAFALRSSVDQQALLWTQRIMYGAVFIPLFFSWYVQLILDERYSPKIPTILSHSLLTAFFLWNVSSPAMIVSAHWEEWGIAWQGGWIFNLYSAYYLTFMGFGIYLLAKRVKKTTGLARTQALYVLLGGALSSGVGLLANIALPLVGIVELNKYGPLGTLAAISFLSYAIIRHRLMDVNLAFRYTFIYGLFIATLAAPMLLVVWWSKSLVVASIFILVALGIAPKLMTQWKASFTRIVDKLAWFQGKYEGLKNVGYYERVVLGSISLKHWYVNMVDSVNRLMETECVVGYMLDTQLDAYLPQAWSSLDEEGAVRSMRGEKHELLALLKEKKGIVFRDSLIHELPNDRARQIDEMMEILNAHLCAPFSDGDRIVGFITVGRKLKKGVFHFKTDDINFDSLRQTLDLAMTEDKNIITTIERINKRLDVEKGPFNSSEREILDALNALVDDKGFLNEIDLNDLDLRSEGIQLLKKYQDGTHLPKRKQLILQTAILRSLLKNEIRPGPEDLINAEDIDALSLLFSAGQETLMVMTTAVTQQKRSAEWAHDLCQPFDKGNFQLIKDLTSGRLGPVTLEQKRALFAMKEDAEFVRRKLESLINPQGDNLQMGDYDVRVLLQIFILKIQTLCTHHQIGLKVALPEQTTKIRCDAEILNFRVLGNLSDNAIRHTPPGGNIHLGVEQREDKVILFIRNTGGDPIPPEKIPTIFDRGTQGNGNAGLAGLGLFNVAQAMEAHGGKVWVESSKEAGTTFFLQFPAVA